jgi:hypothetical protein
MFQNNPVEIARVPCCLNLNRTREAIMDVLLELYGRAHLLRVTPNRIHRRLSAAAMWRMRILASGAGAALGSEPI